MKDARLMANNQYAQKRESDMVEGKTVTPEPWFDQAVTAIADSPLLTNIKIKLESYRDDETLYKLIRGVDRSELPGQTVAILEGIPAGFPEEIDAVANGDHEATNQAAWLWGYALSRVCTGVDTTYKLLDVCFRLAQDEIAYEAFLIGLSAALESENSVHVLSALNSLVEHIANSPEKYVSRDQEHFRQIVQDWKVETNLASIWSFNAFENFPYYCDSIGILEAVRRSDPVRYLQLLETAALPPIIEGAFSKLDVSYDFDVILQLLTVAPLTHEVNDGNPVWNKKLTAPILIDSALEHVKAVADVIIRTNLEQKDIAETERDTTTNVLLQRLTETLLGRDDGTFLAIHWMCHLIERNATKPWGNNERWSPIPYAIEAIASGLYSKGIKLEDILRNFPQLAIPTDEVLKQLRQSGVGDLDQYAKPSGLDILLACLWITNQSESKSVFEDEELLRFLDVLLIRQDGGLYISVPEACPTDREYYPALLYSTHNNPYEAWNASWSSLAEQRRLFRHRWADSTAPRSEDPSFFLANVGLATVDWLISPEVAKPEQAFPFWKAVFNAVFNVFITPPSFNKVRWNNLIAKLFSRLPHASTPQIRLSLVGEYLLRLGGNDELFIWSLANVCQNGVNIRDCSDILEKLGKDLKGRLEAYVEWEGRESNQRKNGRMIEVCQSLIQEMHP